MDVQELESLETKTKAIIDTLSALEAELKLAKDKNLRFDEAIDCFADLSSTLSDASADLCEVIEVLRSNDLVQAIVQMETRLEQVVAQYNKVISTTERLDEKQSSVNDRVTELNVHIKDQENATNMTIAETRRLFQEFDSRLSRIDRNTQKGFGKEKDK